MREYREQKKGWSTEEWEMREYREQKKGWSTEEWEMREYREQKQAVHGQWAWNTQTVSRLLLPSEAPLKNKAACAEFDLPLSHTHHKRSQYHVDHIFPTANRHY
jgi:hypothetical protein